MKLLFAPDSFKGTLAAEEVCEILALQAKKRITGAICESLPVADGGEGLVNALYSACGGELAEVMVRGPLNQKVGAHYAILADKTAAIEMSAASGITLVPKKELDPLKANTFGTGELILDAVGKGCKRIILGLGGSATNDGGMGLGAALGIRYLDGDGAELAPCGENAQRVERVDASGLKKAVLEADFTLACDVANPLCGENGASAVYGPQKGATPELVRRLDAGLFKLCRVIEAESGKKLLNVPGMGAAGGMALPLAAFLNARMERGLEIVLNAQGFDERCQRADIVITGEGRTDSQSAMGKVVSGVAQRAKKAGKPVIVLSGALEEGCEKLYTMGVTAMFSCSDGTHSLEWQLEHASEALAFAADQLFGALEAARGK